MKQKFLAVFILLFLNFSVASATVITANLINTGGSSWQAEYTVENDTLGSSIEEFTVWFDVGLYDNISIVSTPTGWNPLVVQPDASIPDAGFYDATVSGTGISSGSDLEGFTVEFDWLGGSASMSQFYEIIDPDTFDTLDDGYTDTVIETTSSGATSIPEPSSIALFILGFAGFAFSRKFYKA